MVAGLSSASFLEDVPAWLSSFDCHPTWEYVKARWEAPVVVSLLYVGMVFGVPALLPPGKGKGLSLRPLFALWNLVLSAFSFYGAVVSVRYVAHTLRHRGVHFMVCSDDLMFGPGHSPASGAACYGPIGVVMTAFLFSKIAELLDTAFLVLQRKPVTFLQWYHHLSVLLVSWYAYAIAAPTSVIFATVNYTVHAVMYFYFGLSQYTKQLGFMRQPITSLQLLQMVLGVILVGLAAYFDLGQSSCTSVYRHSYYYHATGGMYLSYLILFAKLYYDSYIARRGKQLRGATATKPKPE
eukprot:RCo008324